MSPRLERDVVWNLVPVGLLAVVGLGLNLVIGGAWGPGALGVFNQVTTVYMVFATLGSGCLQYSVLRAVAAMPGDPARIAAVAVGGLVPGVVIAAVTTGAFVALHAPVAHVLDSDAVGTGMLWAAPGVFCFSVNKILLAVTNGLGRMRAYAIYVSARYLLIAAGLGLALAWHLDVARLPVLWTFVEGVLLLVLVAELLVIVPLRRAAGWRAFAREHLDFGARGVVSTLAFEVNSKLDVWMVGMALSDRAVGIYAMAATIAEGAMQIPVAVQNTINPPLAAALAAGRPVDAAALIRRTRRWFVPAMLAACTVSVIAYPFIIPAFTGDASFAEGSGSFALLVLGVALTTPWLPFNQLLLMGARPGWHSALLVVMLATNLVANVLLVPAFGLAGAATAATLALIASAVLLRAASRRLLRVAL